MKEKLGKTVGVVLFGLAFIAIMVVLQSRQTKAVPLDTYHSSWHLIRETADQDGDTFALVYNLSTASNFASKDSATVADGGPYKIRSYHGSPGTEFQSSGGAWMFAICGKNYGMGADNAVDATFSFNVIGWSRINGMLQSICEGSGILGNQAVIIYPDGGDAVGELVSETGVTYTHGETKLTVTNKAFADVDAEMTAYVTGTNITSGYYAVTTATDSNNIVLTGITSTGNNTDSTVQINPSFWADTITLDETTKWPSVGVFNSGDNEMSVILIDTTGLEWIQFVVYDADAATTVEAGDISVFGRLY